MKKINKKTWVQIFQYVIAKIEIYQQNQIQQELKVQQIKIQEIKQNNF